MSKLIKRMFTLAGILVMLIVIALFGTCIWVNITHGGNQVGTENPAPPDISKAQYTVYVENTGTLLYTNNVDEKGNILVLTGFWELKGQTWTYNKGAIILDKAIFGVITVGRR